jgi:site-specific recombinase XerD
VASKNEADKEWAGRAVDERAWLAYRRVLVSEGKSPDTLAGYRHALELVSLSLPGGGDGVTLETMTTDHVTAWLEAGAAAWARDTLATYSGRVRTYCRWALSSGYADRDPMASIRPVRRAVRVIGIPDRDHVRQLADMLSRGKDFESRRDWAIVCLLAEPGTPRATEMAMLRTDGVNLKKDELQFWGKGSLERAIGLGAASCRALTLYLRMRDRHKDAARPELFLGKKGPMTRHGVRQMLQRRCAQAGVPPIAPHHFRHLTADAAADAGMSVGDMMNLFGWRSPMMATRYGAAAAGRRAVRHAREMSIGDKILTGG